jgi:hypothetical protein
MLMVVRGLAGPEPVAGAKLFSNREEGPPDAMSSCNEQNNLFPQINSKDMPKPLTPDEVWLQAERRAARRREYGISLHAPFSDKYPALPYMTAEEREAYLSAIEVLAEGKKEKQALITDAPESPLAAPGPEAKEIIENFRLELRALLLSMRPEDFKRYVEAEERLGLAVGVIEQIVTAVVDRLPEKEVAHE